jgi:hypothetical protein
MNVSGAAVLLGLTTPKPWRWCFRPESAHYGMSYGTKLLIVGQQS